MHVSKSFDDISKILYCLSETEAANFVEVIKQGSSVHVLDNKIDVLCVVEAAIEPDYVWMFKAGVQPNLISELIDHLVLNYFCLHYFFKSYYEASFMISSQKHLSKFSHSQHLSNLKPIDDLGCLFLGNAGLLQHFLLGFALHNLVGGLKSFFVPGLCRSFTDP